MNLKAPFPWFGGKSRAAHLVWPRFGEVDNLVDPFCGSLAIILNAPRIHRTETVNDKDGFIANFWRALQDDPDTVAEYADWPVNENDLHARHVWLVERKDKLQARLEGDPDFYDAKIAGWWVWGICCWIGDGFCSGKGPWRRAKDEEGDWVLTNGAPENKGVNRKLVHLGRGRGVNRKLVHLGPGANGMGWKRGERLLEYMHALAERLSGVRVCCGDWKRVCGPTPTVKLGLTAVFLDPPYSAEAGRTMDLYRKDSGTVAHDVREWAIEHGDDPRLRIALCGYEGEHAMPRRWKEVAWKTAGGYSSQGSTVNVNRHRERLWFSPHCLRPVVSRKNAAVAA